MAVGPHFYGGGNISYAPILKTTNGGLTWGYQIADTAKTDVYYYIKFLDRKHGWAWPYIYGTNIYDKEIHTIVGGSDTTFITSIKPIIETASGYKLSQNYPNPFNIKSKIKYQISKTSNIKILIFDVSGKGLVTIVDKQQNRGDYEVTFDGSNLPSGVYFYSLFADGVRIDTKKMLMIK